MLIQHMILLLLSLWGWQSLYVQPNLIFRGGEIYISPLCYTLGIYEHARFDVGCSGEIVE